MGKESTKLSKITGIQDNLMPSLLFNFPLKILPGLVRAKQTDLKFYFLFFFFLYPIFSGRLANEQGDG